MTAPILVVDDDAALRRVVSQILAEEGYPIETAAHGAEALQVLERVQPALVLLDMRMPVLDGWGFAHALHERGLRLPLLVMTAAHGADAQRWAHEVGASAVIAKPFDLADLLAVVERWYAA